MTMTDTWAPLGPAAAAAAATYPACRCAYCLQTQQVRPPCGCPDCLRKWNCDSLAVAVAANSASHLAASSSSSAATPPIGSAGWSSSSAAAAAAAVQFIQPPPPTHLQQLQPPPIPPVPQGPHQHGSSQQQQQPQHHISSHHLQQQQQQQQQQSPHFLMSSQPAAAATDPTSSDEALSPLQQEDAEDGMGMGVKEASKLQQEIVKAWKQKKRPSCEMKTRTQDKYRQVYSSQQRFELEKEYHFQKYISTARKSELSRTLRLSERQIKIWFQNRRAKERRQKKNQQRCDLQDSPPSTPDLDQFVQDGVPQMPSHQQLVKQEGR